MQEVIFYYIHSSEPYYYKEDLHYDAMIMNN